VNDLREILLWLTTGHDSDWLNVVRRETESILIEEASKRCLGNQSEMAKLLGIDRNTLRVKAKELDLYPEIVKNFLSSRLTLAQLGEMIDRGMTLKEIALQSQMKKETLQLMIHNLTESRKKRLVRNNKNNCQQ
jgi:DNA-binding XRE family transcriptional regulator